MLTENKIKEELNLAYVLSVAASKKFATEITRVDSDSVDATITYNGYLSTDSILHSPEIKLQLKATSGANIDNVNNEIVFPLPIKNYNDLRLPSTCPRLLVIMCLPEDSEDWLRHSDNELVIKKCCHYLNLNGFPESPNISTVTVRVPLANTFSPDSIHELMVRASKQEIL
ncbi:uncharacterized protein DUF4365 [Chryseobacterium sp. CBTAP 102]|uniref:DUF4365 domain-containing protein n=1 Tax=Chryseobacterium sp. CBTAP 102 TaxID=2135644 RepID=UPI000D771D89|nr:DUF4365 domain-containing protein [Chryseobacterium sp. CBTAP 102]PXW18042.1 uncharacterized protein DUF4365 [Chryseobacterium sp. CBTAP 102]